MSSLSRHQIRLRVQAFAGGLRHAFALPSETHPLSADDSALLMRVADAIVDRGMVTPALLFLESMAPLNFLGSQALHFFTPLLDVVVPRRDLERMAQLLERRETLARLADLIDHAAQRSRVNQAR